MPQFHNHYSRLAYKFQQSLGRKYNYAKREVLVLLNSRIL